MERNKQLHIKPNYCCLALVRPFTSFVIVLFLGLLTFILIQPQVVQASANGLDGPAGSGWFGASVVVLPNGNYVVTDPMFSAGAQTQIGAVYLYAGTDHHLISTLTGSTISDTISSGGVTVLKDGNFVVVSPRWINGATPSAGAITWCSATTGCPATISAANSLVGSHSGDALGTVPYGSAQYGDEKVGAEGYRIASMHLDLSRVVAVSGTAYLVPSPQWDSTKGAVTYCASGAGCVGTVSSANSLVGATAGDAISLSVTLMPDASYVVHSASWHSGTDSNVGAVVPCPSTGCAGVISFSNSLHGTNAEDNVGQSVVALTNGGFVVQSYLWGGPGNAYGAVTYCASVTDPNCARQAVANANSLTGNLAGSQVGYGSIDSIVALTNGDYVAVSEGWKKDASTATGAVTYCTVTSGSSNCTGQNVSAANSLTGDWDGDSVGNGGVTPLPGTAFAVSSNRWHQFAGAVTYCASGAACTGQVVSTTNSLAGANGDPAATEEDAGGADRVGYADPFADEIERGVAALSDGGYVVGAPYWDSSADTAADNYGAAAFCPASGCTGYVTYTNSLVGPNDGASTGFRVTALRQGAALIISLGWVNDAEDAVGAATYCANAAACMGQMVSTTNSLVGDKEGSGLGLTSLVLSNGAYLVGAPNWSDGSKLFIGALTWCPPTGCMGITLSSTNSLVGSQDFDIVGYEPSLFTFAGIPPFTDLGNGHYVVKSDYWKNGALEGAGATTLCWNSAGCSGPVTTTNSVLGSVQGGTLSSIYQPYSTYAYDTLSDYLLVGLPLENKINFLTPSADPSIATQVTLTVSPANIYANGLDKATLTISATNASGYGWPMEGKIVTLTTSGLGTLASPTVTLGMYGSVTTTFTAGNITGTTVFSAQVQNASAPVATTTLTLTSFSLVGKLSARVVGTWVTYTFAVTNTGNTTDTVIISGSIPAQSTLIGVTGGVSVTTGGDYDAGYVTTSSLELGPGQSHTLIWVIALPGWLGGIETQVHVSSTLVPVGLEQTLRLHRLLLPMILRTAAP